jgi:hypothetical protein
MVQSECFKCKSKVTVVNAEIDVEQLMHGKLRVKGVCREDASHKVSTFLAIQANWKDLSSAERLKAYSNAKEAEKAVADAEKAAAQKN